MGNPTDGAPQIVVDKLCEAAKDPRNHRYSASKGIKNLRREVALKYQRKWGVNLDPETEVLACIGSKEGFSHMCLALLGTGRHGHRAGPGVSHPQLRGGPGRRQRHHRDPGQ